MPQKREPQYTGYLLVERHAIGTLGNELHLANIDNTRSSLRLDILPTDRPTARIEHILQSLAKHNIKQQITNNTTHIN